MLPARLLFITVALIPSLFLSPAAPAPAAVETAFYAVSYVETKVQSIKAARTALVGYRETSRKLDGFIHVEVFEQVGRPGHFAIIEAWRDQPAFDARDSAVPQQLAAALQPIRVSGYDQRPYKVLTTAAGAASPGRQAMYVISHVDVTPNPLVPPMLRSLAETSRKETGNLRFDVLQSTVRANHFTVIETWRDPRGLDSHVSAAHTRQYRDELQPLTGSPLDERIYIAVE